jgi:AbrB family looped-hinge helix DNA binding protein
MHKTSVTRKGQTVVPAPIRKRFNIKANSKLVWSTDGKVIEVTPIPADPIRALRGSTEKRGFLRQLLKSRREDKNLER